MSDQRRDARGRFAGGINSMFRQRAPLHVGVGYPERNDSMNERLRAGRGDVGDEGDATPPALEGLDGDAGSVDLTSPADRMNVLLRRSAGYGPSEIAPNGLPLQATDPMSSFLGDRGVKSIQAGSGYSLH